ncbi:MAG TPA: two-component sensor histidine kinase [Aurantimonas coralicida]|uniref:histidine kinase n=2 Tax=root TaxID=1 RepID=A0A9C9TIE2_9HYPH|nr:two-component sensor histidine kinase [Aurantimonas coralicida]HEU01651.1 two-component sensor histidine kinase [Aurantimonas coralicida]
MMRSLKGRLFIILVVMTGLVWLSATAWIYLNTRAEVERVLDARLMEAARMVSSLIDSQEIDVATATLEPPAIAVDPRSPYERQLTCQIWSLTGSLIGRSDGAPNQRLSDHADGFAERVIDGRAWRVYAVTNTKLGVQVLVGDNLDIRARLVRDVVKGLLLPMVPIVPTLAALIWFGVGRGMRPLDRLAAGLAQREAENLHPIAADHAATEIRPVVAALNGLFGRVQEARERERHFLTYAAHELRTPLAGLKTQAEISLKTDQEAVRTAALKQIVTAVDRTSRLVRQLLETAEAEAAAASARSGTIRLSRFLRETVADQAGRIEATGGRLVFDASLDGIEIVSKEILLALAVRNLVENAVNHSPQGGAVVLRWSPENAIVVEDEGAGMPPGEIERATDRFFRGANRSPVGSGLGLSIAKLCAEKLGGELELTNRAPRGFRAALRLA